MFFGIPTPPEAKLRLSQSLEAGMVTVGGTDHGALGAETLMATGPKKRVCYAYLELELGIGQRTLKTARRPDLTHSNLGSTAGCMRCEIVESI